MSIAIPRVHRNTPGSKGNFLSIDLVDEIETHKLEEWEAGDAVARPMGLMYRCLQKLGGDAETRDGLYRRICRLDPLQAIAFPGGGGNDGAAGG